MNSVLKKILNYDILIFDCDGVILDSNYIKTEAFYESIVEFGENIANKFVEYHKQHGGISRYEKFDYFFQNILKDVTYSKYKKEKYIKIYANLIKTKLFNSNFTNGFLKFIDIVKDRESYVISGSDECELREVLSHKKVDKYFKNIYGSPKTKIEIIREKISYKNKKVLFLGDSATDYKSAIEFGFDFLFISDYSEWQFANNYKFHYNFKNFNEIFKERCMKKIVIITKCYKCTSKHTDLLFVDELVEKFGKISIVDIAKIFITYDKRIELQSPLPKYIQLKLNKNYNHTPLD